MMAELRLAAAFCIAFLIGFAPMLWLVKNGKSGLALTYISLIGAAVVIGFFAAFRLTGQQALVTMAITTLGFCPALLGGLIGGGVGRLIDTQRNKDL